MDPSGRPRCAPGARRGARIRTVGIDGSRGSPALVAVGAFGGLIVVGLVQRLLRARPRFVGFVSFLVLAVGPSLFISSTESAYVYAGWGTGAFLALVLFAEPNSHLG